MRLLILPYLRASACSAFAASVALAAVLGFALLGSGCGEDAVQGEVVEMVDEDGTTRSGMVHEGLRVGSWEERWPDGRLRMRGEYQHGRLSAAQFYHPDGSIGLRYQRQQPRRGPAVTTLEAVNEDGSVVAAVKTDGSAPSGDIGLIYARMQALPSRDSAQAMTLATMPVSPWQLSRALWDWTRKQHGKASRRDRQKSR